MATVRGVNNTKAQSALSTNVLDGVEWWGDIHTCFDYYTAAGLTVGDGQDIRLGQCPEGARLVDWKLLVYTSCFSISTINITLGDTDASATGSFGSAGADINRWMASMHIVSATGDYVVMAPAKIKEMIGHRFQTDCEFNIHFSGAVSTHSATGTCLAIEAKFAIN